PPISARARRGGQLRGDGDARSDDESVDSCGGVDCIGAAWADGDSGERSLSHAATFDLGARAWAHAVDVADANQSDFDASECAMEVRVRGVVEGAGGVRGRASV